ncbi:MAG: hypothetical protein ACI4V7_03020 [Succinivibrionaceae bacterium]
MKTNMYHLHPFVSRKDEGQEDDDLKKINLELANILNNLDNFETFDIEQKDISNQKYQKFNFIQKIVSLNNSANYEIEIPASNFKSYKNLLYFKRYSNQTNDEFDELVLFTLDYFNEQLGNICYQNLLVNNPFFLFIGKLQLEFKLPFSYSELNNFWYGITSKINISALNGGVSKFEKEYDPFDLSDSLDTNLFPDLGQVRSPFATINDLDNIIISKVGTLYLSSFFKKEIHDLKNKSSDISNLYESLIIHKDLVKNEHYDYFDLNLVLDSLFWCRTDLVTRNLYYFFNLWGFFFNLFKGNILKRIADRNFIKTSEVLKTSYYINKEYESKEYGNFILPFCKKISSSGFLYKSALSLLQCYIPSIKQQNFYRTYSRLLKLYFQNENSLSKKHYDLNKIIYSNSVIFRFFVLSIFLYGNIKMFDINQLKKPNEVDNYIFYPLHENVQNYSNLYQIEYLDPTLLLIILGSFFRLSKISHKLFFFSNDELKTFDYLKNENLIVEIITAVLNKEIILAV